MSCLPHLFLCCKQESKDLCILLLLLDAASRKCC
nr:MAG TPA: hypothetical protein [Caudoviricetes sp.]